jgi:hypothetical protein
MEVAGKAMKSVKVLALAAGLAAALLLAGCTTANEGTVGTPLFSSGDIAPLQLHATSAEDGGWTMEITTRGPQLEQAVVVFADHSVETAELSGVTATLSSANPALMCVMVKVAKDDYWYFDKDYWYFDKSGQMMTPEQGEQWYHVDW